MSMITDYICKAICRRLPRGDMQAPPLPLQLGARPSNFISPSSSSDLPKMASLSSKRIISSRALPGATIGRQMSGTTLNSINIGPSEVSHFSMALGRSSSLSQQAASIPQACASFTKSGFTLSTLIYLPSKNSRCQIHTICCRASFITAIFTGRLYLMMVCKSMCVMLKDPSPSNRIVRASGLATWVPTEKGSPAPITPKEPLVIIDRGRVHRMNWQAII
mmetsp:Transcript_575/g.1066  ORF Transcript_575/g.1066 Transcript_575/m.1066 type:complete len:220 (+) Transcript_575:10-669(+)